MRGCSCAAHIGMKTARVSGFRDASVRSHCGIRG